MLGTETWIWLPPVVVTSDSPTPRESTRCWMIVFASSRLVWSTDPVPVEFLAVNVMVVPPCRSRPSLGVQVCDSPMSTYNPVRMTRKEMSVRTGCVRRMLLLAT